MVHLARSRLVAFPRWVCEPADPRPARRERPGRV